MVDSYRTEEEQVAALREWWRENRNTTIVTVVLALGVGFGWQGWQNYGDEQAESAASVYLDLLDAAHAAAPLDETQAATARHLAATLKTDYRRSIYAQFAALQLARLAVNGDDLETAEQELRWVLSQDPRDDVRRVTQLRLARVMAARGEAEQALEVLALDAGAYRAAYAEARGDIHLQLAQREQALAAYREAAEDNESNGVGTSEALNLKLQSLQMLEPRAMSALPRGER